MSDAGVRAGDVFVLHCAGASREKAEMGTSEGSREVAHKRMIECSLFSENEEFGALDYFGQVLWIGMFTVCPDDQGRMLDNAQLIKSRLWPYRDVPLDEVERTIAVFEEYGWIIRYEAGGKSLIQLTGWWEHQPMQWAMPSRWAAPPGWKDRVRAKIGDKYITENWKESPKAEDGEGALPRRRRSERYTVAVQHYFDVMRVRPNKIQQEAINAVINESNLVQWDDVLSKWRLAGYNPTNVAGMLDWMTGNVAEGRKRERVKPSLSQQHNMDVEQVIKLNERGEDEVG